MDDWVAELNKRLRCLHDDLHVTMREVIALGKRVDELERKDTAIHTAKPSEDNDNRGSAGQD